MMWAIENSKLWNWNILAILYPAHKQLLGLRWFASIQVSDNLLTIDDNTGDALSYHVWDIF
jgi:hypothetical protein